MMPKLFRGKQDIYSEETVKKGSIETYYIFSGNVESKDTQNIISEKIMQISDIKVSEGDKVEKDDKNLPIEQFVKVRINDGRNAEITEGL